MAETNYLSGKLYVVCLFSTASDGREGLLRRINFMLFAFFLFHEIVPFVKKLLIIDVISIKMSNFATLLCAYIGNFLK